MNFVPSCKQVAQWWSSQTSTVISSWKEPNKRTGTSIKLPSINLLFQRIAILITLTQLKVYLKGRARKATTVTALKWLALKGFEVWKSIKLSLTMHPISYLKCVIALTLTWSQQFPWSNRIEAIIGPMLQLILWGITRWTKTLMKLRVQLMVLVSIGDV